MMVLAGRLCWRCCRTARTADQFSEVTSSGQGDFVASRGRNQSVPGQWRPGHGGVGLSARVDPSHARPRKKETIGRAWRKNAGVSPGPVRAATRQAIGG